MKELILPRGILLVNVLYLVVLAVEYFAVFHITSVTLWLVSRILLYLLLLGLVIRGTFAASKGLRFRAIFTMSLYTLAELLLMPDYKTNWFLVVLLLYSIGNIHIGWQLYQNARLSIVKSLPVIAFCVGIDLYIMIKLYDEMGYFVYPITLYMIILAATVQAAYLRFLQVNKWSYLLIMASMVCYILAESLVAFIQFKQSSHMKEVLALLGLALGHLLLINGLITEGLNLRTIDTATD